MSNPLIDIDQALLVFRNTYGDAIVAGGSVRDFLLGRKPKDIDIFTVDSLPADKLLFPDSSDMYGDSGGRIMGVTKPESVFMVDFPCQVIQLNEADVLDGIDSFCFGLSQCWYDGKSVKMTEAFLRDVQAQCMTVTRCGDVYEARHILKKYESLRDRYPEYPMVIPAAMQEFFDRVSTLP